MRNPGLPDEPEAVTREPVRPLGAFSHFVVGELPAAVAAVRDGRGSAAALTAKLEELACWSQSDGSPEALLDATMAESALHVLGREPGPRLRHATDASATLRGDVPSLTYGTLVLRNPLDRDPRVFTAGSDGAAELYFYQVHAEIEGLCAAIIGCFRRALSSPDGEASDCAAEASAPIDRITALMREMIEVLPPDAFPRLRPFFAAPPSRAAPGPSGKYSAGVFAVDALVAGGHPAMRPLLEAKMRELPYYPRMELAEDGIAGQPDMRAAMDEVQAGRTLLDRHRSGAVPTSVMLDILDRLRKLRMMHYGLATKFVPDALFPGRKGTGGEGDLKAYLLRPRDVYEEIWHSILPGATS